MRNKLLTVASVAFMAGMLLASVLIITFWADQIDCLVYPGTDWCLGCVEDCLDPMVEASR